MIVSTNKEKKAKTDRQHLYSVLMKELAGDRGEELADLLVAGKDDEFKEEFAKSVANMIKRYKLSSK